MKKIIVLLVSCLLFFDLIIFSYAESFTAYGSVTDQTSQVNILTDAYINSQYYSPFNQYLIMRVGEYQYRLFTALDLTGDDRISYIDYQRYSIGSYNYEYRLTYGSISSLSYSLGNYTAVGNLPDTLQSSDLRQSNFYFVIQILLIVFIILFIFNIFRIKTSRGYSL